MNVLDFSYLDQAELYRLKRRKKLKVNYQYYRVRCPCADHSTQPVKCDLCHSEGYLDLSSLLNLVESLASFQKLKKEWILMKAPLITQRLENQRKKTSLNISVEKFLGSLKQFHSIEFNLNKTSYFKGVFQQKVLSASRVVLQVVGIRSSPVLESKEQTELVLYDGQYVIQTQELSDCSPNSIALLQLIQQNKLKLGTKFVVWNGEIESADPASQKEEEFIEWLKKSRLKIKYNSIRRADRKLSLGCPIPLNKLIPNEITSALPHCGKVPLFRGVILKQYPLLYLNFKYGKLTEKWNSRPLHWISYQSEGIQAMRESKFKRNPDKLPFTKASMKVVVMSLSYLAQRHSKSTYEQDMRNSVVIEFQGDEEPLKEQLTKRSRLTVANLQPISYIPRNRPDGLLYFKQNMSQTAPLRIEPPYKKDQVDYSQLFTLDFSLMKLRVILERDYSIERDVSLKEFNAILRENKKASLLVEMSEVCDVFLVLLRVIKTLQDGSHVIQSVYGLDQEFEVVQIEIHDPHFFTTSSFPKQHSRVMFSNLKYQGPHLDQQDISVLRTTKDSDFTQKLQRDGPASIAKRFDRLYEKDTSQVDLDEVKERLAKMASISGGRKVKLPLSSPKALKKS